MVSLCEVQTGSIWDSPLIHMLAKLEGMLETPKARNHSANKTRSISSSSCDNTVQGLSCRESNEAKEFGVVSLKLTHHV